MVSVETVPFSEASQKPVSRAPGFCEASLNRTTGIGSCRRRPKITHRVPVPRGGIEVDRNSQRSRELHTAKPGVEVEIIVRGGLAVGAADVQRDVGPRPAAARSELLVWGVFGPLIGVRGLDLGAPLPGVAGHVMDAKRADRLRERANAGGQRKVRLLVP